MILKESPPSLSVSGTYQGSKRFNQYVVRDSPCGTTVCVKNVLLEGYYHAGSTIFPPLSQQGRQTAIGFVCHLSTLWQCRSRFSGGMFCCSDGVGLFIERFVKRSANWLDELRLVLSFKSQCTSKQSLRQGPATLLVHDHTIFQRDPPPHLIQSLTIVIGSVRTMISPFGHLDGNSVTKRCVPRGTCWRE